MAHWIAFVYEKLYSVVSVCVMLMRWCDCCSFFINMLTKILLKYLCILYVACYKMAYYLCQGRYAFFASVVWLIFLSTGLVKKLWTNFREFVERVGLRTEKNYYILDVTVIMVAGILKCYCLFGPICRMDDQRLVKNVMFGMVDGTSLQGRPSREWLDDIKDWCNMDTQYTLSSGWLRIDYYGDMLWRVHWTPTGVEPMDWWNGMEW